MITSLDHYSEVYPPKVGLSSRLVSTEDAAQILWAQTAGLAGDSSPGILGLGLVKDPNVLLDMAMDQLAESLAGYASGKSRGDFAGESPGKFPPKTVYRDKTIGPNLSLYTVAFSLPSSTGKESSGTASVEVSLSSPSSQVVTVMYGVTGGKATGGNEDFSLTGGTLTFAPGEERKILEIPLTNDNLHEPDETIVLTLSDPENAVLGRISTHSFTIVDDDPLPSVLFSRADARVDEGAGPVTVTVLLSEVSGIPVTVPYSVSGGTATGEEIDYSQREGTLTFQPGETKKSIEVHLVDDARNEADETVKVFLGAPGHALLGEIPKHTITTVDDDPIPVVSFSLPASSGREGSGGSLLEVSLSAPSGREVTVDYRVTGGKATGGGIDYGLVSGTMTFPPGERKRSIEVQFGDDAVHEEAETIVVTLFDPENAVLGENSAHTLTIMDDDPLPSASFSVASQRVEENAGMVSVEVLLSEASGMTVAVPYTVSEGTAMGGTDYIQAGGVLFFSPGKTQKSIQLTLLEDTLNEGNETLTVFLGAPGHAVQGPIAKHVVNIVDDDPLPAVLFSRNASSGKERPGKALMEVFLSDPSGRVVTVDHVVTGGTATGGGLDYILYGEALTFLPGEITKSIEIQFVEDALHEKDKTIVVTLSNPANADLGENRTHSFTLVDDDPFPNVSFSRAIQRVEEQAQLVPVPVVLSSVSEEDVSVPYTFTGSATVGEDFGLLTANPLIIRAGARSADILVSVNDDPVKEKDESITISLSDPDNGLLGDIRDHVITIAANDGRVMAVVPFYNRTLRKNAGEIMALQFANQLGELGVFSVLDPGEVRTKLLDLRIVQEDGLSLVNA
ncbi:MAG: hypothetical protein HKM86_12325, partial [Deltaproteobacteria bacterium]|nr:hypothetical protein [Deltaproteobacteria bacterium]